MEKEALKPAQLREPEVVKVAEAIYIWVPVFDQEEGDLMYVLEFAASCKKLAFFCKAKTIYMSPAFGERFIEPWPALKRQAWKQAYAVWKDFFKNQ